MQSLMATTVVEKVEPAEAPVGEPVAPVSHTQSQPQKSSARTILGVRLRDPAPDTPPSAPLTPALPTWPSRTVYEEGGLRDRTIFTAPLAGEDVDTLTIIDPYAAAGDRARRATVDFARMLLGDGTTCSSVKLITLDAESVSLAAPEDSNRQYDDMLSRWEKAFGRVALHYDQLSKQGNRSLHDREVRATTRSGRTILWDLGHGIEGVMTARYRCVVNLTVI